MRYQEELQTLGYVEQSVKTRIRTIAYFFSFMGKEVDQVSEQDLQEYVKHLVKKGLHSNTILSYYRAVAHYCLYLEREALIPKNPFTRHELRLKKQASAQRQIFSPSQIKQLYKACVQDKERIILHLCYGCGLRAKELERINPKDIDCSHRILTVVQGKNNRYRRVPMSERMAGDLAIYIASLPAHQSALLLNAQGRRMKRYTALAHLKRLANRAGIQDNITLHSLRHSIASHLLANGLNLLQVNQFLGHKQLETTEIYTRISKQQLKSLTSSKCLKI